MLSKAAALPLLLCFSLAVPPAAAQNRTTPDGGPLRPEARGAPDPGTETFFCNYSDETRMVTKNTPTTTTSTSFAPLPGAQASMYFYGDNCVRITFTAETACSQTSAEDFCYVRALDNGEVMDPAGGGHQAIDSESGPAKGHAFQWVSFIGTGEGEESHTFTIEWKVRNKPTQFFMDDWMLTVERLSSGEFRLPN